MAQNDPIATGIEAAVIAVDDRPWYRQVNSAQWRAFWATFLGWVLDGFDFTILTFVLIEIQQSFTIDSALAGALGTVDPGDADGRRRARPAPPPIAGGDGCR